MTERHIHTPVAALSHVRDTVALIERAESAGYAHAWVPETWGHDAVTSVAAAAQAVESIGLGTSVLNVYSRSPALLGQTAATLAELAPTSFRLGIGPSGPALIEGWHAQAYDRPLRRTREAAEIIRQVHTGEVVTYDGEVFSLDGFRLRCDPPKKPIPIDLAGLGPKAVELAGFAGDGWHAMLATPEGLADQHDHLRRGATKAGREVDDVHVTLAVTACALEDGDAARELAAGHIAFYTGAMGPFYGRALARQGHEALARQVAADWQAGDRSAAVEAVDAALLDDIAAAGTPADARAQLDRFAAIDWVDAVAVSFPRGASLDEVHATIDALAPA